MTIKQELLTSAPSAFIVLYIIDGTAIGGQLHRVTPNHKPGGIFFGGFEYTPLPIQGSGWEFSTDGSPARPKLVISNVTKFLQPYLQLHKDYVGAKVTRMVTLEMFLDGAPTADFAQRMPDQVFYVESKSGLDNERIEFTLSSVLDLDGVMLPGRQVLRDAGFPGVARYRIR